MCHVRQVAGFQVPEQSWLEVLAENGLDPGVFLGRFGLSGVKDQSLRCSWPLLVRKAVARVPDRFRRCSEHRAQPWGHWGLNTLNAWWLHKFKAKMAAKTTWNGSVCGSEGHIKGRIMLWTKSTSLRFAPQLGF